MESFGEKRPMGEGESGKLPLPPFLREGVRFACTQCGACCTGAPGRVRVTGEEMEAIAAYLGEEVDVLAARVTRRDEEGVSLRERSNGDCVFYRERRCTIHPVKPQQCRTYPFWFRNVRSEAAWADTCAECPGIGEGPVVLPEEISATIRRELEEGWGGRAADKGLESSGGR